MQYKNMMMEKAIILTFFKNIHKKRDSFLVAKKETKKRRKIHKRKSMNAKNGRKTDAFLKTTDGFFYAFFFCCLF